MTILQVGIFRDHALGGCLVFEKGLRQNGCEVERFDYRTLSAEVGIAEMNRRFVERAAGKDLVFIGKGETLFSRSLADARRAGASVALWYGDVRPQPEPWLLELLPNVDFFFMSSAGSELRKYFVAGRPKLAAYFFNPSDPELVAGWPPADRKSTDLLFTGSRYPFASQERNLTIQYLRSRGDVRFFGGANQGSAKHAAAQRRLFDIARKVGARLARNAQAVRGPRYMSAIRAARIGIGVNAFQHIPKYTSDRLTHYTEFGTFFLQWRFPGIEELFSTKDELIVFESVDDLDKKIAYYLTQDSEREEIARKAQHRVLAEYNTKNITAMMLDIIEKRASNRFPWIEILKR